MRPHLILSIFAAFSVTACAPRALYFHETTKVGFAATYNTADSQPVATSFGFKRRIVAVVPGQERIILDGQREIDGTNGGEALSLVSKFNVRAGTGDGIHITNNLASGMAARIMTRSVGAPAAVNAMMHNTPVLTDSTGNVMDSAGNAVVGSNGTTVSASEVIAARAARYKKLIIGGGNTNGGGSGNAGGSDKPRPKEAEGNRKLGTLEVINGVTMIWVEGPNGTVVAIPYADHLKGNPGNGSNAKPENKPDPAPAPAEPTPPDAASGASSPTVSTELFVDPKTGKTMKRIKKADGTEEVVPL